MCFKDGGKWCCSNVFIKWWNDIIGDENIISYVKFKMLGYLLGNVLLEIVL